MAPRKEPESRGVVARVLTAAATAIKINNRGRPNKPPRETWQADAWDVFDTVPEVSQAVVFMSNVVSGVRLFIAERPDDPQDEPTAATDGAPGVEAARAVLERLATGSVHGGLGGLLATSVANLKVPGECYLLGEPERTDAEGNVTPERWDVKSIDEIEIKDRDTALVKDKPGDKGREIKLPRDDGSNADDPEVVFLLRVWDRHPRFTSLARSSLRSALLEADELLLLGRAIRSTARSRFAGAGILGIASELAESVKPEEGDDVEDPAKNPFMRKLAKAMIDPISDEGNADAVVPIVVTGDLPLIKDGIVQTVLAQKFDPEAREIRAELIGRLGSVLDIPIEQITGIAKVNHWGAWQIDAASWARYGQPTTRLIVESWTEGLLMPMLVEANVDEAAARKLMIWFDPSDAVMDPDESKTADELVDRWAIGMEAYRRRKGASDDEAPSEDDLALFERRLQAGRSRSAGNGSNGDGTGPPNDGETPAATAALIPLTTNGNGHANWRFDSSRITPVMPSDLSISMTSASRRREPLGRRLMQIDRSTRTRLQEAAESTLRRTLERAGARVRSRAQGNANVAAAIEGLPADQVCSRLSPAMIAALELSEDDLLADGVDDFGPRFDARVSAAQRRTLADLAREFDLGDDEVSALGQQQQDDRHGAWLWLSGAMLGLARDRLYDPTPQAPALGEVDISSTVPAGMIREAMSRAGGGALGEGMPQGGIATGRLVLDVWARSGQVVGGWEWVHGEPDRPLPGHEDLDGVQFATWDDDLLLVNDEDSWLGVTHYQPGDHDGCQCDFVPLAPGEMDESTDEELVAAR